MELKIKYSFYNRSGFYTIYGGKNVFYDSGILETISIVSETKAKNRQREDFIRLGYRKPY